jgi:hypothetical protein
LHTLLRTRRASSIRLTLQDLVSYCAKENVPFTIFEDWSSILETVKNITAGEKTVHDAAKEGFELYKQGEAAK